MFLTLLFTGGLGFPTVSAGAGLLYLVGRFFYAQGYATGDPAKRMRGAIAYPGLLTLLYTASMTAYKLIN
jgi:glutathione S-transferase